jgi:hypothetical protein
MSKSKLYSTLVLSLLLYGCENWALTAPLRQRLNTFHNCCVRAMAHPQHTSFSSTYDHPAPFVKRPSLAPMYTTLGLKRLDQLPPIGCCAGRRNYIPTLINYKLTIGLSLFE